MINLLSQILLVFWIKRNVFDENFQNGNNPNDPNDPSTSEVTPLISSSSLSQDTELLLEEDSDSVKYEFRPIHFFTSYALIVGIEAQWSLEYSQANKLLLELKFPQKSLGALWMIPPIIGLFVLPIIGRYSDSLMHSGGRRKPILWSTFLFGLLFLIMLGWNKEIASWISLQPETQRIIAIGIVILSFSLLDVANKVGEMINRSLHGDILPPTEVSKGNSIAVWLMGIGSAMGYAVSAIKPTFAHENFLVAISIFILFAIPTLFYQQDPPLTEQEFISHKTKLQPSLLKSLSNAFRNPQLRFLMINVFIGWWALNSLYMFGNIILSVVLGGNSLAPHASHPYQLFLDSVRYAAWGFSGMALTSLFFGVGSSFLRFKYSLKTFYLVGTISFVISTIGLIGLTTTPAAGSIFIAFAGFSWGCQQGPAYIWLNRSISPSNRGEMTAVMWICISFSQIWASFITFILQDVLNLPITWALILPGIACVGSIVAVTLSKDPALGHAKDFESLDATAGH